MQESKIIHGYTADLHNVHSYSRAERSGSYESQVLDNLGLTDNSMVLDLGSGGGNEAEYFRKHFKAKVVESDISLNAGFDRKSFVHAEAVRSPFRNETFDLVHMKDALVHIYDKSKLFFEAYRTLKDKGRLLIVTNCVGSSNKAKPFFIVGQEQDAYGIEINNLDDYQSMLKHQKEILTSRGIKNIAFSPPYFTPTETEVEELAKLAGFKVLSGTLPEFWRPKTDEKNWESFVRKVFYFEK